MKKLILNVFMASAVLLAFSTTASAQNYKLAGGIFTDGGHFGPSVKGFLSPNNALHGMVGFGGKTTVLALDYNYQRGIPNARGLDWYVGVGGHGHLRNEGNGSSSFALVPQVGLEYTIPGVPLNFALDWRPHMFLGDGSNFDAGYVGGGVRFVFK